ncbi:MAG: hypothetical protein KKH02_11335, partial [Proteobacteria bacterium]|nr:hypothetical protein [Pseudomonadota bacterium]
SEIPEIVLKNTHNSSMMLITGETSLPWLQRIKKGSDSGLVSAHSVAELYAILTTLPMKPRISQTPAKQDRSHQHTEAPAREVISQWRLPGHGGD